MLVIVIKDGKKYGRAFKNLRQARQYLSENKGALIEIMLPTSHHGKREKNG